MKKLISGLSLGIVSLLCASVGMAATVTVTPSTGGPVAAGGTFTVLVSVDASMPATSGFTLGLAYDATRVSVDATSAAGNPTVVGSPFLTAGIQYTPGSVPGSSTPGTMDLISGLNTGTLVPGPYDAWQITFNVLDNAANQTSTGAASIQLIDDGGSGDFNWQVAGVLYNQASVTVGTVVSGAPDIVVTDSILPSDDHLVPFGNVDLAVDATATVTVTNNGTGDLTIGTLTLPTGDFSLTDNCSGQVVPASATCTVTVHFIPTANGGASSSFDIPSDDGDTPTVTVDVSGVGGLPVIVVTDTDAAAPIDANDHQVVFGDVEVNTASGPGPSVIVTNNGPGTLHVGTITPPADTHFTLPADACSGTALVGVGANCIITVQFTPTVTGVLSSTFDIPSDDPNTPTVTVTLTGNGIPTAAADIAVTDSLAPPDDHAIPFGSVIVGNSPSYVVTVANNGVADLVVSGVTGLSAPFSLGTNNCDVPVAQNTTCTIDVIYSPTATGAASQTMTIASNDPDTPTVDIALSGTGLPVPTPDITMSTTTIAFGNVLAGSTATPVTVTVTNSGGANLDIGQIAVANPLLAPYGIANDLCSNQSIGAGLTCTFDVTFAPTAPGTVTDAFDVPSNDPDPNEADVLVNVSGTGTVPDINVSDSDSLPADETVAFGNVTMDTVSAVITVTVSNTGLATLDIGQIAEATVLPPAFVINAANDHCSNQSIAAAGTCTFQMTFAPTEIGTVTGSFDIPSNDPDENPVTMTVSGKGVGPNSGLTGGSALDPATLLGLGLLGFAVKRRRRN